MPKKLGSQAIKYVPLSKAEIIKMINQKTNMLEKDVEKIRKGLFELEMKVDEKTNEYSIKHRRLYKNGRTRNFKHGNR